MNNIELLNDQELQKLKEFTEWLIDKLLKHGVPKDDLHARVDEILKEQLKRLNFPS